MTRVLLVDNQPHGALLGALGEMGYEVSSVASGDEAVQFLSAQHTDMVLLHVGFGGAEDMRDLDTIRRGSTENPPKVILFGDQAHRASVLRAASLGVHGYVLTTESSVEGLLARVASQAPLKCEAVSSPRRMLGGTRYASWRASVDSAVPQTRTAAPASGVQPSRSSRAASKSGAIGDESGVRASVGDLAPIISRDELLKAIDAKLELRPLGASVQNVMSVCSSASCSADDVARAILQDQALSIRMLRIANSATYSRGRPVNDVKDAVRRVGVQEVRSIVTTLGILEQYDDLSRTGMDPHQFWEHSLACGLIASRIAQERRMPDKDGFLLWGLIHDVGRLLLSEHLSDEYGKVLSAASELRLPLEAVEARMLSADHAEIIGQAMERWRFDASFVIPVTCHHASIPKLKRLKPKDAEAGAVISLANRVAHSLLLGNSGDVTIHGFADLMEYLAVDAAMIDRVVENIDEQVKQMKFAMMAQSSGDWSDYAMQVQKSLDVELRPLGADTCAIDPVGLLCNQIRAPETGQPPNLGLVHLRTPSDLESRVAAFEQCEKDRGVEALPVLVTCECAKRDVSNSCIESRPHSIVELPMDRNALLELLRRLVAGA